VEAFAIIPPMSNEFILETTVRFSEVDRDQVMLLPTLLQLLQEAAIRHADMYGVGADSIAERGTSWVLNRLAVALTRYPRRDEALRVETWSTGVRGFRGYREFRLFCGDELLLSGSSLWLWIDLRTRMLTRVPQELESAFPVGGEGRASYKPDLERLRFAALAESATATPVTVRYSDCDANGHVNNTAYFDYLQTALVRQGRSAHPQRVELQYLREIPPATEAAEVRFELRGEDTAFAIGGPDGVFAQGIVA
jgi:medium-chain acyl-[acyl-carrier-protein] hydrolase